LCPLSLSHTSGTLLPRQEDTPPHTPHTLSVSHAWFTDLGSRCLTLERQVRPCVCFPQGQPTCHKDAHVSLHSQPAEHSALTRSAPEPHTHSQMELCCDHLLQLPTLGTTQRQSAALWLFFPICDAPETPTHTLILRPTKAENWGLELHSLLLKVSILS
jgi:hypothetical protein